MSKKHWSVLGLALGALVLGVLMGLMTVGTVAADPTPGVKIQIPRIDLWIDYDEDGEVGADEIWETWIQVQNVGTVDTGAIFLGWGEYSGLCPTNDPGPQVHYCALIRENALWTLKDQLDQLIKSGIIYTVTPDVYQEACQAAEETEGDTEAWRCWVEEWEFGTCEDTGGGWADPPGAQGEEVAVTVNRAGLNAYGTFVSSTYTGIAWEMEGEQQPYEPYEYYAPYVMKGYNGLDTEITIQNSGQDCTAVWIDYMQQGSCQILYMQQIEQLAPGEAIRVRVPCDVGQIPCFWLGSAHIRAEQPLGIIVDETSFDEPCPDGVDRGTLLTHRARPKVELRAGEVITDTTVYADLIFREWSGWDASIQVQNLSRTGQHTFVTVDFMDNSGDEILFLADWVCPTGSTTFYLPIVNDLGFEYVGAAEIQSHNQIDYPGGWSDAQPIFVVVDLNKPDDPDTPWMDAQGGSYNAHPESQKELVKEIALPFIAKDADNMWTSLIAIRNNSNCNKIKPKIWFKDETGTLLCELNSFWLRPKHVKLIDLNNIGCLYPGYIGAGKVIIEQVEQLCDTDMDGVVDQKPVMPSVIVVEKGIGYGDVTKIYEGIPYKYEYWDCNVEICGHAVEALDLEPIWGAEIYTVEFAEPPFTVAGTAYISPTVGCPDPAGPIRLADAYVELQVLTCQEDQCDHPDVAPGDWGWVKEDDTTTNADGNFDFENALELEAGADPLLFEDGDEWAYRLSIYVAANGGTVSYSSREFFKFFDDPLDPFDDQGDVEMDFTIDTNAGGLDLTSGDWCNPVVTLEETVSDLLAETDSTGHFCFDYSKTAEPEDISVRALHTDHFSKTLTLEDVECDDQVVNFELDPECDDVWVNGTVYDKMTGESLVNETGVFTVTVSAGNNAPSFDSTNTITGGKYELDLTFSATSVTTVTAEAFGYYSHTTSLFIPKCYTATVDFELHQKPKSRALLYYGNGGVSPDDTRPLTYTHMAAYLEDLGLIVDYTDKWPDAFDWTLKYKLIVLLGPGHDTFNTVTYSETLAANGFTWGQKADLDTYLQQHGALVILSDATSFTGVDVENDLLNALPVDLQFALADYTSGHGDKINPIDHCLTGNVHTYSAIEVADNWTNVISPTGTAVPGWLIRQNEGSAQGPKLAMYAADVPSHGNGWVIILGDMHGLSDAAWMSNWNWPADNEWVARNWLDCDP